MADRFSDSPHSAGLWSAYELARRDSRHGQVHDQNRHELWAERNELQQQVQDLQNEMSRITSEITVRNNQLAEELESILHGLDGREAAAAEALQDAILQIFEDAELGDTDGDTGDTGDAEEPMADEAGAAALPPVLAMTRALLKQRVGALVLTESALSWCAAGVHVSAAEPRIRLANVVDVQVAAAEGGAQMLSVTTELSTSVTYSFKCEYLTAAFMTTLDQAVAAHADAARGVSSAPAKKLSARVKAGRELRQLMLQHTRLLHDNKSKQAAELLARVDGESSSKGHLDAATAAKRREGLAQKRAGELRDVAFSFGGLELTRKIVARFMVMPEVRPLLPGHLQKRRAADEETRDELLDTARAFLTGLLGTKGRRSDEDANAWMAAAVGLIPRTLFQDKRGRSASRVSGLSYRQLKRACAGRGEMEDLSKGWIRKPPSRHSDRIDYAPCRDFWHEHQKVSVPDNQNKQMVRVYGDFDEATGQQSYELHERRAQLCTDLAALPIFRDSVYGERVRAQVRAKPGAAAFAGLVGRRQLVEQKCACIKPRKESECDCELCTFVEYNTALLNRARPGWREAARLERLREAANGGAAVTACPCQIHSPKADEKRMAAAQTALAAAKAAAAKAAEAAVAPGASADLIANAELKTKEARAAETEATSAAAALADARARAVRYDSLAGSTDHLLASLMPCGFEFHPDYTAVGDGVFRSYRRDCCFDPRNCPRRWGPRRFGCGWDAFDEDCPIECNDKSFSWKVWEPRLRGTNDEGKETYFPEFVPRHGTRNGWPLASIK